MPTYISLISFTQKGVESIKDGSNTSMPPRNVFARGRRAPRRGDGVREWAGRTRSAPYLDESNGASPGKSS
jgi:hypothetical protein